MNLSWPPWRFGSGQRDRVGEQCSHNYVKTGDTRQLRRFPHPKLFVDGEPIINAESHFETDKTEFRQEIILDDVLKCEDCGRTKYSRREIRAYTAEVDSVDVLPWYDR